ncbi:hypothetical protein BDN72DRAFT_836309 [Pluteus cervinus]|uniref:Uncharacterized protein n=1 Tax=Pluteus cervinus TaxID=181527 RepID=A0ACD3B3V2_9AGAR|nr:hypothetical protein BDN72DRAFT_836309 [Pluteus cervinus]
MMAAHVPSNLPSFILHGLCMEDAYTKLDKEIAQLQERLCSLRTLRNSLAPISKVPTELLSKMFSHTQDRTGSSFPDEVNFDTRFFLSWVCRHWRFTALATPSLWNIISMKNRETPIHMDFAKEFILRSRKSDLSVNLSRPTLEVLNAFVPEMHRVQHLRVLHLQPDLEFDALLIQAAPVLASLELLESSIPVEPMSGVHPQLQSLIVTGLDFVTPSELITPVLTRLHIAKSGYVVDVGYLLGILPSLQNLMELVLVQSFNNDDTTATSPSERICLPELQTLSIVDDKASTMFHFLEGLDLPHTAITLTWPEEVDATGMSMDSFGAKLGEYVANISIPIRHVKLERIFPNFILDFSSTPSQHRYSCRFPTQELDSEDTDFFVGHSFRLDDLETIYTNDVFTSLPWLTKLRSVTLDGESAMEQFLGMCEWRPKKGKKKPFPALKELTICHIKDADLHGLDKVLASRFKAKMGLDKLVFSECPDVDVNKFRDFSKVISNQMLKS